MNEEVSMNKMGVQPVKKLLLTMGVPMIISMAIQALYNIVDSYFVSCMKDTAQISNMGDCGVNALTLAFPVQMLMIAIGVGTGVGINAVLSRSLGEGNREKANKIAGNAVFLGICSYVVFLIFGLFGVRAYISSQTNDPVISEMAVSYLEICCNWSFGVAMYMTYEKLLQSTGRTTQSTIAQISGAVVNIVLDPILIFGYCGLPEMGMNGAAYATIIGQFVSFILDAIFHYIYNKKDFDTKLSYIKPNGKIIKDIYRVGIPAIFMQALMSFMTYGVNIIFNLVSTASVTAYGLYYKIQQFVFFAAFGMNNAMIPVIAFNYGKNDKKRVNDSIKYGMIYTLVIMGVGIVLLQAFAYQISGIFAVSAETQKLCILAIRIITLGYIFVGANIAYQGIFQALGHGVASLVLSMLRLIIIALPLAWVFTFVPNAESVIWWAFPIAELGAFISAIFMMKSIRKKQIDKMSENSRLNVKLCEQKLL